MIKLFKKVSLVVLTLVYLALFVFDIVKVNLVYLIPLLFELSIFVLYIVKNKKGNKIKLEKIVIIQNIVLFICLILALLSNYILFEEYIIKILLTLTIFFQVLVFYKMNNMKDKKVKLKRKSLK